GDKAKTYGNFLDNINFQIYHALSGSTTIHGSAVVSGSDGSSSGTGGSSGHTVTVDNKLATYVKDGEPLKIQAIVNKADADEGCEYVGLYYTKQDENGYPVTEFLKLAGNEIEDTGSLTDEEKKGKWIKSTNDNGDIIYTYYLNNVTTATDLHFVFVKSPTVTYDPNGGKDYIVERTYNISEPENVYSFKPVIDTSAQAETGTLFIDPYVSHAAEGQNDGWKFMGWKLTGDIVDNIPEDIVSVNKDQLGSMILPAKHTIACDYTVNGVSNDQKAQFFKIYYGNVSLTKTINRNAESNKVEGVTWTDNNEEKAYANVHKGITMIAQWRWRQAAIPQTYNNDTKKYDNSYAGGTVEFINVDTSDENYNGAYNASGGKSYHAATNEKVTIKATANEGYHFIGWYDEKENLITTNDEYSYSEAQEGVNTYYARFSNSVTQTYIRQVGSGDDWQDITDDEVGTLGRYSYTDAVGMPISSTATAGNGYKFIGWYDSEGNKVADNMLINNGATISYTTTGNATYYARFQATIKQTFVRQVKNGDSWKTITDNSIATLSVYTHTDIPGVKASSKATAGNDYIFEGWYDKDGNQVSTNATWSYTTTGNATYYARFSKKIVTQTFIRQVKNGDSWEDTTEDSIGILDCYSHVDEIRKTAESTATAGNGYKFVGWYDSAGNKVADDMLAENGLKISYTTTGNATYYARFEKLYTLSVSKIDGDSSTSENKVPIPGVEFTLYKADETGDVPLIYNGKEVLCTKIGLETTALNAEETEATAVFEDVLSAGSVYYLAETKVPTGYRLREEPVKISVDIAGSSASIDDVTPPKDIADNKLSIELANYLTLTMPVSGTLFTGSRVAVIGLLILTSAVIGLFLLKLNRFKSINKK
ncbi:MAG: prealbumin-like fold domain-containing protein, partial [Oscillospiraceae bacterium]|nr:prealbumin-like fold domain-containing protein [Oscillospiraceae bacterium]